MKRLRGILALPFIFSAAILLWIGSLISGEDVEPELRRGIEHEKRKDELIENLKRHR